MSGEVCVLLGAGSSADAGVPMAAQMTKHALASIAESPDISRSDWPGKIVTGRELLAALGYVFATLQTADIRNGVPGAGALEAPNIERLVSAVQMLAERDDLEIAPFVTSWDRTVQFLDRGEPELNTRPLLDVLMKLSQRDAFRARNLEKAVGKLLASVSAPPSGQVFKALLGHLKLHVATTVSAFDAGKTAYLDNLVSISATFAITIGTLNYDNTIEESARRVGVPVDLGIDSWTSDGRLGPPLPGAVRLLKLHGSANWEQNDDGAVTVHDEPQDPPALIYGQRGKLQPQGPFLELLEEFRRSLWAASHLLVIGYSFADQHINQIVRRWLATGEERTVSIVDPFVRPAAERSHRVYRGNNDFLDHLYARFGFRPFRPAGSSGGGRWDEIPQRRSRVFFHQGTASQALQGVETIDDLREFGRSDEVTDA